MKYLVAFNVTITWENDSFHVQTITERTTVQEVVTCKADDLPDAIVSVKSNFWELCLERSKDLDDFKFEYEPRIDFELVTVVPLSDR